MGPLGSGKTALSMCYANKNFSKDEKIRKLLGKRFILTYKDEVTNEKKSFERLIVNKSNIHLDKFDNAKIINNKDLVSIITEIHEIYSEQHLSDEELVALCDDKGIGRSLMIIDECQDILAKSSVPLSWFLSYCRHMYIDVILITQGLGQIKAEYKVFSDEYYVAFSAKLRFNPFKLRYSRYLTSKLTSTGKITFNVKVNKAFFETYVSGNSDESNSVLVKGFAIALSLIFLTYFFLKIVSVYFFSSGQDNKTVQDKPLPVKKIVVPQVSENENFYDDSLEVKQEQEQVVKMICNKKICYFKNQKFPYMYIKKIINIENITIIHKEKIELDYYVYFVLISQSFRNKYLDFQTIQGATNNENNNSALSSGISNFKFF